MTQIVVTLEKGADSNLLRRMIENMKGVLRASLSNTSDAVVNSDTEAWIAKMRRLSDTTDMTGVDMDDERTRYILSK